MARGRRAIAIGLLIGAAVATAAAPSTDEIACDRHYRADRLLQAIPHCTRAAAEDSALAMTNLFLIKETLGPDLSPDLLRRAARLGNARAQFELAVRYLGGYPVEQDNDKARRWFRAAADNGWSAAQLGLGFLEQVPDGARPDWKAAERHYLAAFETHPGQAAYRLATLYRDRENAAGFEYWSTVAAQHGEWNIFVDANEQPFDENYRALGPAPIIGQAGNPSLGRRMEKLLRRQEHEQPGFLLPADRAARRLVEQVRNALPPRVQCDLYVSEGARPELFHIPIPAHSSQRNGPNLKDPNARLMVSLWRHQLRMMDPIEGREHYQARLFERIASTLLQHGLDAEALDWFERRPKEAEISSKTLFEFGQAWEAGRFGAPDRQTAIVLYLRAAEVSRKERNGDGRAALEMAIRYGSGDYVAQDLEKAVSLLTLLAGRRCEPVIEQAAAQLQITCPDGDGITFQEAFAMTSGLFGEELREFGRRRIGELAQSGNVPSENRHERAIEYAALLRRARASENLQDLDFGPYLRLPSAPERQSGEFSRQALNRWRDRLNRLARERVGGLSIDLVKDIVVIDGQEITQTFEPASSVLPVVVVLVHDSEWREGQSRSAIEAQMRRSLVTLAGANRLLNHCGLSIRVAGVVYVDGMWEDWPLSELPWLPYPGSSIEPADLDWRFSMPPTGHVTVVFLNDKRAFLGERSGSFIRVGSPSGHTLFGSNRPLLIADASPSTVAHEIGHALGLPHPRHFEPSVMGYDWAIFEDSGIPVSFAQRECREMLNAPMLETTER